MFLSFNVTIFVLMLSADTGTSGEFTDSLFFPHNFIYKLLQTCKITASYFFDKF